jgi:hypothetical protein
MFSPTRKTDLCHLPDELLLRILKDLSDSDLYSVSFHSPRIHPLAISVYLSHHEIFGDEFAAISEESGLQLTNPLQIATLPCILLLAFSDPIFRTGLGISEKDKGIHNPEILMKRMSRIRHITLDSDDVDLWSLQQILSGGPVHCSFQEWSNAVRRLIHTLGKGHHLSFNIRVGKQYVSEMRPEGHPGLATSASKNISYYKAAVSQWKKRRVSIEVQKSAIEDIGSTVDTRRDLDNIADIFIASSLRFRTSAQIFSYPIERLSLDDFEMEPAIWATLLPSIELPTLRAFRFSSQTLPFIHVSKFLARHRRITALTLKGALIQSDGISISLPDLRILEATSDHIAHHLTHSRFSTLDQIVVWPSLDAIGDFRTMLPALRHFRRKILLCLHLVGTERHVANHRVLPDSYYFALPCVETLELHLTASRNYYALQHWQSHYLSKQWINSRYFPALKELRIVSPDISQMSVDARVRTLVGITVPCFRLRRIGLATDVTSLEIYCAICYRCMSPLAHWRCRFSLW